MHFVFIAVFPFRQINSTIFHPKQPHDNHSSLAPTTMRARHLKPTLLSFLGLTSTTRPTASAQETSTSTTSTWGLPFSVDGPSTQSLLPSSSQIQLIPSSSSLAEPSSESSAVDVGSTFSVTLPSPTTTGLTLSTPISVSGTESGSASTRPTSRPSSGTVSSTVGVAATSLSSTGAATAPTPYVRMGVVGVMAGVAGVFVV